MWADDIIRDGQYFGEFIESKDIILIHFSNKYDPKAVRDTIGYIPNSVIRAAETAVKAAFDANDKGEVLRLFNEAFTFRPTTGAEYRALKALGNN